MMQSTLSKTCKGCRDGEYRDCGELNYYGSDLNKLIDTECIREMTCINIDCLMYKRSKKILRVIESKHKNERVPGSQKEVLQIVAWLFELLNSVQKKYRCEVYVISSDHPFTCTLVEDLISGEVRQLNRKELKDFLEFK